MAGRAELRALTPQQGRSLPANSRKGRGSRDGHVPAPCRPGLAPGTGWCQGTHIPRAGCPRSLWEGVGLEDQAGPMGQLRQAAGRVLPPGGPGWGWLPSRAVLGPKPERE